MEPRRDRAWIGGLLLLYGGVRAAWISETFGDRSVEPLEFGLLAHDLTAGLAAPLPAYLTQANEGCSLWFGGFCAPWMLALGDSFLTLRLCQIGWHALGLIVLCLLARRVGGRWGMVAAALLWILPPPGVGSMMHRGWFNHPEAWLLLGASLLAARRATLAGWLAGSAIFFQLSALPAAAAVLAILGLRGERRGALALGALVGAAPAIAAAVFADPVAGSAASDAGLSLDSLRFGLSSFVQDGPRTLGYGGWAGGAAAAAAIVAAAAAGFAVARRSEDSGRRTLATAAAAAIGAHVLACVASGLDLSQGRYLAPLGPWLALLAAGAPRVGLPVAGALALVTAAHVTGIDRPMPVAFEAELLGHSALEHDGLRHALPGDGRWSARVQEAKSSSLCRVLGRNGVEELDGGPDCLSGWWIGRGEADESAPVQPRRWLGWATRRLGHEGEGLDLLLAAPLTKRRACVAAGFWAFETGWHSGEQLERIRSACPERAVAAGAGMALAPRFADRRLRQPDLSWWWEDVSDAEQAAFNCAVAFERSVARGAVGPLLPVRCAGPEQGP